MSEQVDPVTGFSTKVITESKGSDKKPTVYINDSTGNQQMLPGRDIPARYVIPVGAQLLVSEGQEIHSGDVIAKIHRETTKHAISPVVSQGLLSCSKRESQKRLLLLLR